MELNKQQMEAVHCTEGPLLIIAGAGSGKTRVLTERIACLISEKQVNPWNILAITFTNKAAGEMRERVSSQTGARGDSVWVSTFHSMCVRILRRYIDRLGYDTRFTIYDADDQKSVIKNVLKQLDMEPKLYKDRAVLAAISAAKNEMVSPEEYRLNVAGDWNKQGISRIYTAYQQHLRQSNALDFDDLLVKTVELFKSQADVLEAYQERFRYIMVDEYQDTNAVQFALISLLAKKYRNLCVVGDDDQSIYKFRGADIRNILDFEKVFPDATVIKLEQNYRSTQNILRVANAVISNNRGRKVKNLWSDNGEGKLVKFKQLQNAFEEAEFVAGDIGRRVRLGEATYSDFAVLYRTNAQSRLFEEKLLMANIPYRLVGGVNFYARLEIKDLLSYLKTVDNARDDLAVRRIINVPKRGIGAASLAKVQDYADEYGITFYEALRESERITSLGRAQSKIRGFVTYIESLKTIASVMSVSELLNKIIEQTGYVKALEEEGTDEARARIENIDELITKVVTYEQDAPEPSLSGFLAEVALVSDLDTPEDDPDRVVLMTLHSAKGLEFPQVYMTGMEDGIFPSFMTIVSEDRMELEEERRLCYVGITRAMQELTMTSAQQRMIRGETQYNKVSRFVHEIPREFVDLGRENLPERKIVAVPRTNAYSKMRQDFRKPAAYSGTMFDRPAFQKGGTMGTAEGGLNYEIGDTVRHVKFGTGMVLNIVKGAKDYEVTVDFDKYGTKKMFAAFAKLQKI